MTPSAPPISLSRMMDPRVAGRYDEKNAASFLSVKDKLTGLPEFLGVRLTSFEPGRLRAEMVVHAGLLTPFGNMHGGVISAVCDHVLGCVCYPHMPRGSWAATTEFKVNLLAPVSEGTLEAVAEIVSMPFRRRISISTLPPVRGPRLALNSPSLIGEETLAHRRRNCRSQRS